MSAGGKDGIEKISLKDSPLVGVNGRGVEGHQLRHVSYTSPDKVAKSVRRRDRRVGSDGRVT